ncbi:hypothetical protein FF125_03275 [Aureibaculum algae]|uniref:Uncharacterized protein n=2 Tax=Aureibaculum TaxID=2706948 RepID=A0A5B7TQP6_9FLAO|nr:MULTISPECIES: hypothetical protein [Aureibaculum]MBJ2173759.1 hypothetical protein [Aureibaculum flavum]QCX37503.1 hypothetical protein FF125_03275 [Aureibaculum algae]
MKKEDLKKDLIDRINEIDDENKLTAIQTILNTLESEHIEFDNKNNALEPEDFGGYIKEWLKSM